MNVPSLFPQSLRFRHGVHAVTTWLWALWLLLPIIFGIIACRAPDWWELRSLTITLAPGQSLTLGREALGTVQADVESLQLVRTANSVWQLSDRGVHQRLLWHSAVDNATRAVREWPLVAGTTLLLGTETLHVVADQPDGLHFTVDGQPFQYTGRQLQQAGVTLLECGHLWRARLHNLLGYPQRPLQLGGSQTCAEKLAVQGLLPERVHVLHTPSGFVLQQDQGGDVPIRRAVPSDLWADSLSHQTIALSLHGRLLLGGTEYHVVQTTPNLVLAAQGRLQRRLSLPVEQASAPVRAHYAPLQWMVPHCVWGLLCGMLGILGVVTSLFLWHRGGVVVGALLLAGAQLAMYLNILSVPILWPYLLAWPAVGIWYKTVRTGWGAALLAVLTLLTGTGLITLFLLGIGAAESSWMRYGGNHAAVIGALGWATVAAHRLWQAVITRHKSLFDMATLATTGIRWHGAIALVLLSLQAAFGDEAGWQSIQPFEWVKLALVLVTARALRAWTLLQRGVSARMALWPHVLAPTLLLLVAHAFALVLLRDFSPLVLLTGWALACAAAAIAIHPRYLVRGVGSALLSALLISIVAGTLWLHDHPNHIPIALQTDRIRVWSAPERHFEASYQIRRALEFIRLGETWGHMGHEPVNGRVMSIPVVESDFTPAFFLNRFGHVAGGVLMGAQLLLMMLLIGIAIRAYRYGGLFSYFTLCGGAGLWGTHCLISWGTNLGFLPVMGQPMPLLSSAGSHITFFLWPIMIMAVVAEAHAGNDSPSA